MSLHLGSKFGSTRRRSFVDVTAINRRAGPLEFATAETPSRAQAQQEKGAWPFRPVWDLMEDRTLLSTIDWTNTAGGDWDTASNWTVSGEPSVHQIPTSSDVAVIDIAGTTPVTITHSSSTADSVNSLMIISSLTTLDLSKGSISIAAASTLDGSLTVDNAATLSLTGVTLGERVRSRTLVA